MNTRCGTELKFAPSGLVFFLTIEPRALPWAIVFGPVGAGDSQVYGIRAPRCSWARSVPASVRAVAAGQGQVEKSLRTVGSGTVSSWNPCALLWPSTVKFAESARHVGAGHGQFVKAAGPGAVGHGQFRSPCASLGRARSVGEVRYAHDAPPHPLANGVAGDSPRRRDAQPRETRRLL